MSFIDKITLETELASLPGWAQEGKTLTKTYEFEGFMDGVAFVNKLAAEAERQDHHPDLHVSYGKVKVVTWSHDVGGITARDLRLIRVIESLR